MNFVKFVWNFLNNNRKWILSIYYVLILNKVIIFLKILTTFGQFKCYGCILWMISLFLHCSVPVSDTEPSVEWNGFMWLSMETRTKKQKKNITKKKVGTNYKLKFKRMFLYFCLEKYFIKKKKKENKLPYFQFCHSKSVLEICFCFTFCEETFFEVNFIGRFPPLHTIFLFQNKTWLLFLSAMVEAVTTWASG